MYSSGDHQFQSLRTCVYGYGIALYIRCALGAACDSSSSCLVERCFWAAAREWSLVYVCFLRFIGLSDHIVGSTFPVFWVFFTRRHRWECSALSPGRHALLALHVFF